MSFASKTLEFNIILEEISNYSYTNSVKKKINGLTPMFSVDEINERQNKINEAILITSRSGRLPFLKDFDIDEVLSRIKLQRDLNIRDLQDLRLFLRMSNDIKSKSKDFYKENIELSFLSDYFLNLNSIDEVLDIIDSTIAPSGEVLNTASESLFKIRRQISRTERNRDKVLADLLLKKRTLLNDSILIMRNDRYCLPVKTDLKNQIKGVVHDVSASGTTTYIEPLVANELSNLIVKLKKDEEVEIFKILKDVSFVIVPYYQEIKENMNLLLSLDFYFAAAEYSLKYDCHKPNVNDLGNVNLIAARHPLINQDDVVPVNIKINEIKPVLMITGPNTGGKTVALKTLGLLSMMAQSGLLIPASSDSEISVFSGVYADIGDHQSIKQSLSTFSSHIKNVDKIIKEAKDMSLILLDELGSGTDPNEGTSLAMAIVDYFLTKNIRLVLTTHYSELKIYAYESPLILNASVKFDIKTLKPLYEIEYGRSGSSNALMIAERLGFNKNILNNATNYLKDKQTDLSTSVEKFEEKIELLEEKLENVQTIEKNILAKEQEIKEQLYKLELEKEKIILRAQNEARGELKRIKEEAELILELLEEGPKEHEIAALKHELSKLGIKKEEKTFTKQLSIGDFVYITSYQQVGEIINKKGNKYVVKFGIFELEFAEQDLIKREIDQKPKKKTPEKKHQELIIRDYTNELDLRGTRFEDVKEKYHKFIDQAILANLKELRIIHGYGTGAVRKALYKELKDDKNIKSYRYGGEFEGMSGVTIVTLA